MEHLPPPVELELTGNVAQNWEDWLEEFQVYLRATGGTGKTEDVQAATFLHLIGRSARKVANTFTYTTGEVVTVTKLIERFDLYCKPRKSEMYSRFKLEHTHRKSGETADQFLTRLKNIAKDCEYDTQENKVLRDRVVFDLQDEHLRERLLEKDNLTLEKAMDTIRTAEISREQSRYIKEGGEIMQHIQEHGAKYQRNFQEQGVRYKQKSVCKKCGRSHDFNNCPAFRKTCFNCGQTNHFAVQCDYKGKSLNKERPFPTKGKPTKQKVLELEEGGNNSEEGESFFLSEVNVEHIDSVGSEWFETLWFGKQKLKCKLDSGAQTNVLPYKWYKQILDRPRLTPTSVTLIAYGGEKIKAMGRVTMVARLNDQTQNVPFIVVDVEANPVLGLDTCTRLRLLQRGDGKVRLPVCELGSSLTNIGDLKREFEDVFSGIGCYEGEIHLETKPEVEPVVHPPRKIPIKLQDKLKVTLDDLLQKEIISKVTYPTDWVNSLIMIEKADGELRLCLDPRNLNKALKREHYQMPTGEEIFLKLRGMEYFTVIDMKWGFWNLKLDSASADLCVFNTPYGRYRFNRLPFGISVAPEIFQRINNQEYGDMPGIGISTDDFIIGGRTEQECLERVKGVLTRAREKNNKFNAKKIQLCAKEVKYLGRIISKEGIRMDPDKVKAIGCMSRPENKGELRTFLGMTTYLMPYVEKLSDLTAPLRELMKENVLFYWDDRLTQAFDKVKEAISAGAQLSHFDPNKPIIIQADASKNGLGACLMQEQKPVAYSSRALTDTESRYSQIEKEFLAIVCACEKFHYYIYGIPVVIHTDHKPLLAIVKKGFEKITPRLQRFLLRLQRYTVELVYTPGKELKIADALSRNFDKNPQGALNTEHEVEGTIHEVKERHYGISGRWKKQIGNAMETDAESLSLVRLIQDGWPEQSSKVDARVRKFWQNRHNLHVYGELILNGNKVFIPEGLRQQVLNQLHESHQGVEKTKMRARQVVYWPGINNDIENLILECPTCLEHRKENGREPLHPHEVPNLPWDTMGMDIFEIQQEVYLIMVDYYSKFPEVVRLPDKTAKSVITACQTTFARHGIPKEIVSDNMPFASYQFKEFCEEWDIVSKTSSPRFPQSNGLAERNIQTVKKVIKKSRHMKSNFELALLEFRNTPLTGTTFSPAQLLMSRTLRTKVPVFSKVLKPKTCTNVQRTLRKNQQRQKRFYDRRAKSLPNLQPGEICRVRDNRRWSLARVEQKAEEPNSFWVNTRKNGLWRRNRKHLLKTKEKHFSPEHHGGSDLGDENSDLEKQPKDQEEDLEARVQPDEQPVTRSGRMVKKPGWLKDFVT